MCSSLGPGVMNAEQELTLSLHVLVDSGVTTHFRPC